MRRTVGGQRLPQAALLADDGPRPTRNLGHHDRDECPECHRQATESGTTEVRTFERRNFGSSQVRKLGNRPDRTTRTLQDMKARVVAVDVGSVNPKNLNFAWAALDLPTRRIVGAGGRDPEGAAAATLEALHAGTPVALGFEAPLMVPVSPTTTIDGWITLGQRRAGETVEGHSRPWSAGAGSGALATGLAQLAWTLERIGRSLPVLSCTTAPAVWLNGGAQLFVWEAFVSGTGKPIPDGITQHAADAAAAAEEFADRLDGGTLTHSDVTCLPSSPFNLAAAAATYAGLTISPAEIRSELPVYRTRSATNL